MKNNFFKKWLALSALFAFLCFSPHGLLRAQSTANYAFTTNTSGSLGLDMNGNTVDMATGTTQLVAADLDNGVSAVTGIGFDLTFYGSIFTQFSANSNGVVQLGSTLVGTATYLASGGSLTSPRIGALVADLRTGSAGKVHYKLVGTAPNRCLVVEFLNMSITYVGSPGSNDGTYQVRLYETSGVIEYVYGSMFKNNSNTTSTAINTGFSVNTTANTLASVTTSSNTVSYTTFNLNTYTNATNIANLHSAAEGTRRIYRFTPPVPTAPTALSFTSLTASSMTLNWTDNSTTELGYRVYRSLDNVNYTLVSSLAANTTTYPATGLNSGTLYYWKVVSYEEIESLPLSGSQSTNSGTLSGIKTVGSGGDYANLTTAFADINTNALAGNVELQLITGYPASPETYPILSCNAAATGPFAVKVYPTVTGLSITSANATGTLNLNAATNVTFDGRVNQTGANDLVISNTNAGTTSYAVQFVNDAKINTLQYLTIHSVNTSTTSGTIVFAGTTGTTGNDNNIIDHCDIKDGATTPLNGIYSAGTSTAIDNSGNTVSNSNIYNYFGAGSNSNGILLASNSSAWTINANKFYQTATRTSTSGNLHRAVNIVTANGNGYVITNNVIGYASAVGTGVTTYNGAFANRFFGIELTASNGGTASSIQGNTITGISLTTTSGSGTAPGIFSGISVLGGTVSIGNTTPNIIGAGTGTGAISVTTSNTASIFGIHANSTGTLNVSNNVIGSISGTGSVAGATCSITAINLPGGGTTFTVNGNTIGGSTVNSITSGTSGLTTAAGSFTGILIGGSVTTLGISGNTISNAAILGASGTIYGINAGTSQYTVTNNVIRDLSVPATSGGSASILYGFYDLASPTVENFTGNQINNLSIGGATTSASNIITGVHSNTASTSVKNFSANTINGLNFSSSSTGSAAINGISSTTGTTISIFKNKIYNLSASGAGSSANGVLLTSGTTVTLHNNLIGDLRTPQASGVNPINGMNITGGTTVNVYYNTVYLNGSSSGTNFGSSAISAATGTTVDFRNNIFHNASVSNGTGLTVAYRRSSTTLTSYASTSNRNDFVAPVLFHDGTNSDATLTAYQTRVGARDANSISQAPNYASTIGSATDFLHINLSIPTLLESGGVNIAGLTTDFDGTIRQGNPGYAGTGTAPDIGAHEFELVITNCSTVAGGTITPASASICVGATRVMTVTGATNLAGISYQWKVSNTPGGPYSNVSGGSGATTNSYTTGAMTTGTYYFVMETTCSFGPVSGLSTEFTLTVNPIPVVAVNPSSGSYCSPGGTAVSLAATGATTYAWTPAAGLSATNLANVDATPSATTTYSVVGTALGCVSAATPVTITVSASPTFNTLTATPAAVCEGSNSQLAANASIPFNAGAGNYSFAGSTGTYTPIVGTALAAANGDDVAVGNLPIGFNFTYAGGPQTVFAVASNGFIELGSTSTYVNNAGSGWVPSTNALAGRPNIIAPLWEDNNTTGATVSYETTGAAPNRVLTVQWTGMHTGGTGSATNPTINCQVQLFETSNVIKINYGSTSAALTGTTASIGLSSALGNYLSVTPLSPANTSTTSSTSENTGISGATNFPSGTVYTFTPPVAPVYTYAWTPSTYLSATNISNPIATAVTGPVTYTVVATVSPSGCTVSGNVALTVNPLPTAPTATNSAQCGTQIPTASVASTTGVPTPTFVWYDAPTGGTLLQSSTSTTFTSNVSATTTFSVAELSAAGCESPRVPVTITVASADLVSATTSNATICLGSSFNLNSANLNPTPVQSYTYSWSSTAGSGIETPVPGASQVVTPTAAGSYTYTVNATDGGCAATQTVTVLVNALPLISTATATPAAVCSGDVITLTGTSAVISAGTATVGTQSTTDLGSGVYRYGFGTGDFRHQLLFTAAELNAAGVYPGNITSIAFNVTAVGTGAGNNYTIKMGHTAATTTTATFNTDPTTTVYTNAAYTPVNGVNTHTFSAPFNWNGTSSVLIEICYNVSTFSGGSSTLSVNASTNNVSLLGTTNACTNPTGTTQTLRPVVTFGGQVGTNSASSYNWVWTPGTGLNTPVATTTITNTSGAPVTQAFTASVTNPTTGCVSTAMTSLVTINSAVPTPVANNSTQCGTGAATASVTGSGTPGNTFSWYLLPTGGTAISGQTGSALSGYPVSTTTTFYVSENSATCTSPRIPVTVTVTPAPAITIAGSTAVCNGSSTSLTVTSPNDPNYTYTWSGGLGTGATVSASPTVNTTYTVTATDASGGANNGCLNSATHTITVNAVPASSPVVPATSDICEGTVQQLTSGPVTTTGTAILGTGTTAPGATSWPNPFSAWYGGTKHQMMFTAAELTAQGLTAGSQITSVTFDVNAFVPNACNNFTIRMGNTANTALTGFVAGTSTVYGPTTYTPSAAGLVTFTLSIPYTWNGTSNVVVETVHNAGNSGNGSGTRTNATTTPTNTVYYGANDGVAGGIAGFDALTTYSASGALNNRPNIRFAYTSSMSGTWSPTASLYTNPAATVAYTGTGATSVYAKPTTTTTYTVTYTGSNGCTAQTSATITVKHPTASTVPPVTTCTSYMWPQTGATYTTSGVYRDTIMNAAGCDSVITLNLTINQPTTATVNQTACVTYTWPINSTTYNTSGTHTATIPNAAGCDSVITLNLTINQPNTGTDTQTACGSYTWNGTTYNTSGTYTQILENAAGCDSTVTLTLTINQPTAGAPILETECTSFTWAQNGMTYNTSGLYTDTILNAAGCDSVITLDLTIIQPTTSSVSVTECTAYTWAQNGMTYNASGAYTDTIPNGVGCDSIITLNLTITQPTSSSITVTACGSYTWAQTGLIYLISGSFHDTIQNGAGCDSVITLNLTVFPDPIASVTNNGNGTMTASAGNSFIWLNCATNLPVAGATSQTFAPTANGSYSVVVTSAGGCVDTSDCVSMTNLGIKDNTISTISVHPNPTHDVVIVTMDAASATVEVMDVQGKLIQVTEIKSGDQIDLGAYERGVYTLRIKTEFGTSLERIVKN